MRRLTPLSPGLPTAHRAAIVATIGCCVAYGLMNLSYPWTLKHNELAWSTRVLMALVSPEFMQGSHHMWTQWMANYVRARSSIAVHAGLGGLALSLCTMQFIPGLRQRWPRVHRGVGWSAAGATLLAMVGALSYLWITPLREVFSSPVFGVALWMQAVSTIMTLMLGIGAARQRQWRTHMGWMSLLTALLTTAPVLRIGQTLLGRALPLHVDEASNMLVSAIMGLCVWGMAWWMHRAGDRELPLLPARPVYPAAAWHWIAAVGAAVIVHEGVLANHGLDLMRALGHPRSAEQLLPMAATPWALLALLVLPWTAQAIGQEGQSEAPQRVSRPLALALLAHGLTALWAASPWGAGGWQDIPTAVLTGYWSFSGMAGVLWAIQALRGRLDGPHAAGWRLMGLIHHLGPAAWALMLPLLPWWGLDAGIVLASAAMLAHGWVAWYGFASAFGLPLPGASPVTRPDAPSRWGTISGFAGAYRHARQPERPQSL